MTGRKTILVSMLAMDLLVAGAVMASPQVPDNPEPKAEAKKNGDKQKAPKPESKSGNADGNTDADKDADKDTSVKISHNFRGLGERFLLDQKEIWVSPVKLRFTDLGWIIPYGGVTSTLLLTDSHASLHVSRDPSTVSRWDNASNAGIGAMLGSAAGMWLLSYPKHNDHWRETGFLAGEAVLNSLAVTEAMKYSLGRQRPNEGNGTGPFFNGGVSFPSEHASAAFAAAGVIAHEYPGPLTRIAVYALAGFIDYSRFRARQHFPSDLFVGSVLGNMVGQSVYSRHHDPELGGDAWISASQYMREHWKPEPDSMGSPNVPVDSWVYPAIERLAAQGLVQSEFLNIRPWTRMECVALMNEAAGNIDENAPHGTEMAGIVAALRTEFATELHAIEIDENQSYRLESVYTRITGISGTPLADSYHFGQTIYNDEGRPYQEGVNNITGFSSYATSDRFAVYFSGEYQHAPGAPAYPLEVRQVIANVDLNPLQPATPVAQVDRFTIQNAYLSTNLDSWNFSFGKQDLWWSPNYGSSFLLSNNAEPMYMFRLSRVKPFILPWIFKYIGPMKIDLFVGRMKGNQFPADPIFHGEKISFKPTKNLDFGFSRTTEFGGVGRPMTLGAIFHSYFAYVSSVNYGANDNPGHRVGGFDFSYKLPFVRNWLSIYADSMTSDDPSPIDAPRRAPIDGGLYLAKFPRIPKLDLRVEGVFTDTTTSRSHAGQFSYWELFYHDAYTNNNFIMGSWIGREGTGEQAWMNYWFTPKSSLQFGYRHLQVDGDFIPGGVKLHDEFVKADFWIHGNFNVTALVQHEQWTAPLLAATPQTNWTTSVGLTFQPGRLLHPRATTVTEESDGGTTP
jgi:membrane-associated phospholipid phosphatase